MGAAHLLTELEAAGIRATALGDTLRVHAKPGVDLTPYRDSIRQHKLALLAELRLREQIVVAATAATAAFDRDAYDALWEQWYALQEEAV
jgi:hypothetical protein